MILCAHHFSSESRSPLACEREASAAWPRHPFFSDVPFSIRGPPTVIATMNLSATLA